jgi:hypothetical protein
MVLDGSSMTSTPSSIETIKVPRDGYIYKQDSVEVMLDPSRTMDRYYQFLVSARGDISDVLRTQGGNVDNIKWNGQWEAKSMIGADFWSCELKIPFFNFAELGLISQEWGVNICRDKRGPAEQKEDSAIAADGEYNKAGSFLPLHGIDVDFSRYQLSLMEPATTIKTVGKQLEITINSEVVNGQNRAVPITVEGWLISPAGKAFFTTPKAFKIPAKGHLDITLPPVVNLTDQGDYTCALRISDAKEKVIACQESQVHVRAALVGITLLDPWYRHSIFETQTLSKIIFDIAVDRDSAMLLKETLDIAIMDKGKKVWSKVISALQKTNRIEIPNTDLPYGRFKIVANLKSADGQIAEFGTTECPLWKLPYKKGEVWLGRDNNWYIEGKPFFINTGTIAYRFYQAEHTAYQRMKVQDSDKAWISTVLNVRSTQDEKLLKAYREKYLDDEAKEIIRNLVRTDKDTPKLFAYYLMDEPPAFDRTPTALEQAYEIVKDEDPYHPCIVSDDKMPNTVKHLKCCDIQVYHPYPPMFKSKRVNDSTSISRDAEAVQRYLSRQYQKVSLIFNHMGFNNEEYSPSKNCRIGTYHEFRDQSIMAVASGAKGFQQFNMNVDDYPETSIGFPYLTKELAYLGTAILAPESGIAPNASVDSMKMLLKNIDGNLVFFASSVCLEPRKVTFTLPGIAPAIKELHVVSENRSVAVQNSTFSDEFDTCGGHVYTSGPLPELKSVQEIDAEIEKAYELRRKPGNLIYQRNVADTVDITASSFFNLSMKSFTVLWHLADGYVPKSDNDFGFMHWTDGTPGQFPDWVEINMRAPREVGRVEIYPMEKSLKDYHVQVLQNEQWITVAEVKDQNSDHLTHVFPPIRTDKIRIWITAANGRNCKIGEIEVYEK